jgi:hypothetical protein
VHGAKGGRPPAHGRTTVPSQIANAFNRIFESPDLLSLTYNQALVESRVDQIMQRVQQHDSSGSHEAILAGIVNISGIWEGLADLQKAVDPVWVEYNLWQQALQAIEVARRQNDTERKYLSMYDQMIPADQVIEALVVIIGKALRFITDSADRAEYARDMRKMLPRME